MNPELSNQELLELDDLCGRFEKEWRPDSDLLQAYLSRASERQLPFLIRELVGLECELLRTTGRESSCDAYRKRHPKWQHEIDSACDACTLKGVRGGTKPLHPQQLGDYRILREIGRGSSGIVYEAVQESLGRSVAIKVLTSYALLIPEAIERFQRESRAVAALHHSNIVQVYGTGKQDGLHYFAMQMVDGVSIDHLTRGHQKAKAKVATPQNDIEELLPSQTKDRCSLVADVGLQVASALSYAHSRGILHRDIKPANLLFDGVTVWVTDFGLAKINREESDATQTGDLIGTLRYLPPEAVSGTWDQRGDLYSLGLTLYELLTLQPAFKDRDRTILLDKIAKGEPPTSPRQIDGTIPRDIETVVMKAIAHDPSDRYQSADDMARDLQLFLDGEPILARRQSAFERLRKWTYRNPALAALVALITLLATVGLPSVASLWLSAEVARESAETQRDYADAVGYGSSMQLAQSFIEQRKPNEVRSLLAKWNSHSITGLEKTNRKTPLAWEWNYLNSQVNASTRIVGTLKGPAFAIAVRRDGKQLATASTQELADVGGHQSRKVTVWDMNSGKIMYVLEGPEHGVTSIAFSPDGRTLAAIGRKKHVRIWNTSDGELLQDLDPPLLDSKMVVPTRGIFPPRISFSSSGRWLVCSANPIVLLDTNTWKVARQLKGNVARAVPNSDQLVVFLGPAGTVYDLVSGRPLKTSRTSRGVEELSVSEAGDRLCARSNDGFRLWKLPSFEVERDINMREVYWSSLSPNGEQLVHVDQSGVIQVHQIDGAEPRRLLMGHHGMLRHGAYLADSSRLFTCGDDGTVREWNTEESPWKRVIRSKKLTNDLLGDLAFSHDGNSLMCVSRWDPSENAGRLFRFPIEHDLSDDHPNGSVPTEVRSQQPDTGKPALIPLTTRAKWPRTDFAFSHNGKWVAVPSVEEPHPGKKIIIGDAESGRVNIWSTESQRLLASLELPVDKITSLAWSRDDTEVAVASYEEHATISIFGVTALDESDSSDSQPSKQPDDSIRQSPTHYLLNAGDRPVTAISFNMKSDQIAASTERGIEVWELQKTAKSFCMFTHSESCSFLDWSNEDWLAATYRNANLVRVFDIPEEQLQYEIPAPRSPTCVRFAPSGDRFAIVGYDSLVHLCDTRHGRRVLTLNGSTSHAGKTSLTARVVFSRDGRRIATNDFRGRITIWESIAE